MKYFLLFICSFLVTMTSAQALAEDESNVSIAVVNVTYLLKNAPSADLASQTLKDRFSPREKSLADEQSRIKQLEAELDRNKNSWEEDRVLQRSREIRAINREYTRSLEDFREELRFARDAALDDVQKGVFQAIEEVRIKRKIDIVIQDYVTASQRVDLTPHVLNHLQAKLESELKQQSEQDKAGE
ncbi:OmpH family outer membrane protein [Leucothrix sargassi]|nr:OmpH family outer membrane protein [Leucothrix sargassi]